MPITWVDEALSQLLETGRHRSSFVGAVLLTLPGTRVSGSPPVISLSTPDSLSAAVADFTFEGDLTRLGSAAGRSEQAPLRHRLFGEAEDADCGLCGRRYPVRFLWAAHIKKRAACTDDERRDLDNVAFAACVFGCDALFEAGYIAVDNDGLILTAPVRELHAGIVQRLAPLRGRRVNAHTSASAGYFAWHRDGIYRG